MERIWRRWKAAARDTTAFDRELYNRLPFQIALLITAGGVDRCRSVVASPTKVIVGL